MKKVRPRLTEPSSLLSKLTTGWGFHTENVYRYLVLERYFKDFRVPDVLSRTLYFI